MYYLAICLFLTVLNIGVISTLKVSCVTEEGQDVDWYYLYKLPKHHSNAINSDQTGLRYSYVTSDTFTKQRWHLSDYLINETASFPGRTLSKLYNDTEILLIAYNDQVPDGPKVFEYGHTKGIVATDGINAIWLLHSVPKYPEISAYTYPITGERYGQSFLCITLNATTQMDILANQLLFNEPNIYFSRIPEGLSGRYPALEKVLAKEWRSSAPFQKLVELRSLNGTVFKSFAKSRKFNGELYKDWIAPTLDIDLLVESWRNSAGKLPSDCSRNRVFNVAMIADDELHFFFKSTLDHSKWAVASEGEDDWICVGDINRAEHQLVRGGGSVCQRNRQMANIYRGVIDSFDKCEVKSWRNDGGKLPSDCSKGDKILNAVAASDDELHFSFKPTFDHSKWAVASEGEDDGICVGDINRSEHQLVHGAGSGCQTNRQMVNIYRGFICSFIFFHSYSFIIY